MLTTVHVLVTTKVAEEKITEGGEIEKRQQRNNLNKANMLSGSRARNKVNQWGRCPINATSTWVRRTRLLFIKQAQAECQHWFKSTGRL